MKNKNEEMLLSFTDYCMKHPEMRFWQAVRNWCGWHAVWVSRDSDPRDAIDTFGWENNRKP